ncbi:MAG: GLPGLI family protein [Candidatus Dadabacteria bacterium]
MKQLIVLFFVASSLFAQAQIKEGRVVYERTVQLAIRAFSNNMDIASQLPKSRTDQFELLFSPHQSLWQYLPSALNEDPGTFVGNGVVVRMGGGANEASFQDYEKGTRLDQREIAERNFVVSDTIRKLNWKVSDETKQILNFTAHKATAQRVGTRPQVTMENGEIKRMIIPDTATVVAWFTTDIPVPAGPDYAGQLPGLILELDVNNGQSKFKAVEFSPKVNTAKIKEPKEGKKLTAEEFNKERDRLLDEMRKNMPAGNVIRMN